MVVVVVVEMHEKQEELVGWFWFHQTETDIKASFIWNWRSRSILKMTMIARIRNTLFVVKVIQSPRFFRISLSLSTNNTLTLHPCTCFVKWCSVCVVVFVGS
jgi:hypothetical protein